MPHPFAIRAATTSCHSLPRAGSCPAAPRAGRLGRATRRAAACLLWLAVLTLSGCRLLTSPAEPGPEVARREIQTSLNALAAAHVQGDVEGALTAYAFPVTATVNGWDQPISEADLRWHLRQAFAQLDILYQEVLLREVQVQGSVATVVADVHTVTRTATTTVDETDTVQYRLERQGARWRIRSAHAVATRIHAR